MVFPIKILLADDHPIVRDGLRMMIETDADLQIVAEAGDGAEALALLEKLRPDVAVLDIDMPAMDGFTIVRELRKKRLETAVIFLTMHSDDDIFLAAMDLGVKGYLLKDSAVRDIVKGIKAVSRGEFHVTPSLAGYLLDRRRGAQEQSAALPALKTLTPTELQILRMVADYKSSKEIAAELFVHYRTIENHRTNICQKLGISGNNALLKFALQNKKTL
ncbi:MAG: response regulator transcription factor [Acidobacteria bacterium]|nr:response regulator transcription factor [Acidobacteriota bacterium]